MDMQTPAVKFHRQWVRIVLLMIACFAGQLKSTAASEDTKEDTMDLVSIAKEIRGEIVQIVMPLLNGKQALGSGFWVHQSGYVATCWHVVHQNPEATLTVRCAIEPLFDLKRSNKIFANWEAYSAKVVAKDQVNDLALIKIEGRSPFLSRRTGASIKYGDKVLNAQYKQSLLKAELPEPGQRILLAGYPLGGPYRIVQEGVVASVAHDLPNFGPTFKILISTVANPGNSGGPVFDSDGKVIGVLQGGLPSRQGLDPAQAVSGIAVVVPAHFVVQLMDTIHDK